MRGEWGSWEEPRRPHPQMSITAGKVMAAAPCDVGAHGPPEHPS